LDRGEKDKPAVSVESADSAVLEAAAAVVSSGEVTGKMFETTLLHAPAKLKAKRLLLVGGGKAKSFSERGPAARGWGCGADFEGEEYSEFCICRAPQFRSRRTCRAQYCGGLVHRGF